MSLANELIGFAIAGVKFASMVLEWLMTYAIHSTIIIGGLLLLMATPFGRRMVSGHGSWLWRFALVGAIVTASLQSLRTSSPLAGTLRINGDTPTRVRVEVTARDQRNGGAAAVGAPGMRWNSISGAQHVVKSDIEVTPGWPILIPAAWFIVAASLLTWFLVARSRFLRSIGPRRSGDHTLAGNALGHLVSEGKIEHLVKLTLSKTLTSPVALGSDEICLPERALAELDPIRLESIIAHELAHIVRRDTTWLTIARVIEAVFFFQPLNVIARRRMQEAAEFASDAWASRRVARPLDLAHCLARVAEWTVAAPRIPVPAMAERSGAVLVRRVQRLTSGELIHEKTPGRTARLAAAVALVALVFTAPRAAVGAERPASGLPGNVPPRVGILRGPVSRDTVGLILFRQIDGNASYRFSNNQVLKVEINSVRP